MAAKGSKQCMGATGGTELSPRDRGAETVLSAFCECMKHSLAGWIVPLAVVLYIGSTSWHSRDPWSASEHGEPHRLVEFGNVALAQSSVSHRKQGPFDLSAATVPRDEILSGGPSKDGIPALSNPRFVTVREATFLGSDDRVIGFVRGQEARAYPLRILNYHEIVNDRMGDLPIAVTYCPLCDSAAVFDRRTPLGEREFGVSGLLYNSNVLMYDRAGRRESLWSQIKSEGISGPGARKPLRTLPVELTTWSDWRSRFPGTKVLSPQTSHQRDYQRDPYAGYFQQPGLMFPARPTSDRLPAKERVLGVWTDSASRAYPISAFGRLPKQIEDQIGGKRVVIEFVPKADTLRVVKAEEGVQWMYSLWFAWHAFRPEAVVFQ